MKIDRIIAISPRSSSDSFIARLATLLAAADAVMELVDSAEAASARLFTASHDDECGVVIDASDREAEQPAEAIGAMLAAISHLRATVPSIAPVVAGDGASAAFVAAAFRGGASDFVDLRTCAETEMRIALERAAAEGERRLAQTEQLESMRTLLEDFLRGLVQAERRSLELEARLRRTTENGETPASTEPAGEPPPTVLVVDDDSSIVALLHECLAEVGLRVKTTGLAMEAISMVAENGRDSPFDLILIDKNLPDLDGIKAIYRMRKVDPHLTAMVITGYASTSSAIDAADAGVVGYVLKPFEDIQQLRDRIRAAARRAATERRERRHLAEIKQRHAEFLLRYRRLAARMAKPE